MSSLNDKIGHNSAAFEDAALLADDYIDVGPLSGLPGVDPQQLYAFRHAIKTQGNEDVRQKAITQMLNRARANAALSPTAYRLLEHIARRCRGAWRYCTEPQDTIGFFCGVKHRQSTQRSLAELDAMDLGFIASVEVPCSRGGRPRRYYTVACTGSDRLGSSDAELAAAASRRKLEVMNDRASARLVEALASKASNCCIEPKQQNVALAETSENKALDEIVGDDPIPTQQNVALSKATSCCYAKQHNVAHSVSSLVQEESTYRDTSLRSVSPAAPSAEEWKQIDLEDYLPKDDSGTITQMEPIEGDISTPSSKTTSSRKKAGVEPKPKKSGRRPLVAVMAEVAPELERVAEEFVAERGGPKAGWTESFVRDRLQAFESFYTEKKICLELKDWPGALKRWLMNPNYQPKTSYRGRPSLDDLANDAFN